MNIISSRAAAVAALVFAAQPALAADDFRDLGTRPEHRSAAFAGASFRIPFGGERGSAGRPVASFQIGVDHVYEDRASPLPARTYRTSALELGLSRRSGARLLVGGAPVRDVERRLGIGTGGAIAIGAGIAIVAVVAVALSTTAADLGDGTID